MTTSYTAHLEEDPETGELILPFPEELMDELGWEIGDTLTWDVKETGEIYISKKSTDS